MLTKICSRCKKELSIDYFTKKYVNKKGKQFFQSQCKKCRKIWFAEHYRNNKQYYINRAAKQKQELLKWYHQLKNTLKCSSCGFEHPAALVFHHKDKNKEADVSNLVANSSSKQKILQEINKCSVLCSNCHRILHYNERISESKN